MDSPERNDSDLPPSQPVPTDSSALRLHDRRPALEETEVEHAAEFVPLARPVPASTSGAMIPTDPPMATIVPHSSDPDLRGDIVLIQGGTDGMAVGSAICGMTGLIPLVTQIAGLCLGFASLARIRRARRSGIHLTGKGWAITGIVTSIFGLLGWIGLGLAMTAVSTSLGNSTDALSTVLETLRAAR